MKIEENYVNWCLVIEVGTMNLLRKFKTVNAGRRFLVWKKEVYISERAEAQFKHVLRGNVRKGLNNETITDEMQITSFF